MVDVVAAGVEVEVEAEAVKEMTWVGMGPILDCICVASLQFCKSVLGYMYFVLLFFFMSYEAACLVITIIIVK